MPVAVQDEKKRQSSNLKRKKAAGKWTLPDAERTTGTPLDIAGNTTQNEPARVQLAENVCLSFVFNKEI